MTNEKKQEYTRRISQANETELMALSLAITYDYLEDAKQNIEDKDEFKKSYDHIQNCLSYLQNTVYLGSEMGQNLFAIYQSVRTEMSRAFVKKDVETIKRLEKMIKTLSDSFYKLSEKDSRSPIMENAEILYAGLTYTGHGLGISSSAPLTNRGFLA